MLMRKKLPPPRERPIRKMINGCLYQVNRPLRRRLRPQLPLRRVIHDASYVTEAKRCAPGLRPVRHRLLHSASCRLVFSMLRLLHLYLSLPLQSLSLSSVRFGTVERLRHAHYVAISVDGLPRSFSALRVFSTRYTICYAKNGHDALMTCYARMSFEMELLAAGNYTVDEPGGEKHGLSPSVVGPIKVYPCRASQLTIRCGPRSRGGGGNLVVDEA